MNIANEYRKLEVALARAIGLVPDYHAKDFWRTTRRVVRLSGGAPVQQRLCHTGTQRTR